MATKRAAGAVLSDKEILKRYSSGLASEICLDSETSLWLPSRSLAVNYQTGGGIQYGKIMEVYGGESSGKSLLAKDFGTVAQSLGGVVLWNDAEATFSPHWARANGLDLSKVYLYEEQAVELISDWQADMIVTLRSRLVNNEPILLVSDSIAAYDTLENIYTSQADSKAEMGNRAKAIYTMVRRRNKFYSTYGVCVLYINQLRKKVGATKWEDPDVTPGGDAMKFFASIRLGITSSKQILNEDDEKVGQKVYIKVKKNKLAPPRSKITTEVYFTEHEGKLGYSRYAGFPEILLAQGIVKRKSARWYYKGEVIAHGDAKFLKVLEEDSKLRKKLISKAGINTVSRTRAQMESITRNLYPVKTKKKANAEEEEG